MNLCISCILFLKKRNINKCKSCSIKYKIWEKWKDIFFGITEREFFPHDLAAVWIWQMRCCVAFRKHGHHDVKTREFFCRFVDVCFTCLKAICRIFWKCVTECNILTYLHDVCKWMKTISWYQWYHLKLSIFLEKRRYSYS